MSGWERPGIGGLSQGYLSGRLSPSAVLDDALAGIAAIVGWSFPVTSMLFSVILMR
jgi:hypothetical protein